jgi:hypothetical protein
MYFSSFNSEIRSVVEVRSISRAGLPHVLFLELDTPFENHLAIPFAYMFFFVPSCTPSAFFRI